MVGHPLIVLIACSGPDDTADTAYNRVPQGRFLAHPLSPTENGCPQLSPTTLGDSSVRISQAAGTIWFWLSLTSSVIPLSTNDPVAIDCDDAECRVQWSPWESLSVDASRTDACAAKYELDPFQGRLSFEGPPYALDVWAPARRVELFGECTDDPFPETCDFLFPMSLEPMIPPPSP